MHCLVYVAIENTYMVVKWQCLLMAYSKTVVGIIVGIADTLTRYERQFPLHSMGDSYIAVERDYP